MNRILQSLRKKFPKAEFKYVGYGPQQRYKLISCDNLSVLLSDEFRVRASMLTKSSRNTKFLIVPT